MGAGTTVSESAPRRLLLLRHGRTSWNLEGRVQGQTDVPLDEVGVEQARLVAPALAKYAPVLVRSSDLARARVTAEAVADACGVEVSLDSRLREFDLGERAGARLTDYAAAHADEYAAFRAGRYDVVPGGESREQLVERFVPAVQDALRALRPGELGVVVAHGAALKVAVAALLGWPAEAVGTMHALGNCHWVEIDDSGAPENLAGGLRLVAWNRHA
ncbi:histidine phosphatase family protein [Nocardioides yefusunii]|uniref:Histidine phosphatase family protein n=1 Tax=Nocardioides yefusunii TaxID=2500546 RepID=A0ABW1QYZ1_9ACTN|nr:histidine phosphatase family protein [Nocardioides yefusunii]